MMSEQREETGSTTLNDSSDLQKIRDALVIPTSSKTEKLRREYEERLSSFTLELFCGKPLAVSPLVCARLGFRCLGVDTLECVACRRSYRVTFPDFFSDAAKESLINRYREMLFSIHTDACPFRRDAECHVRDEKPSQCDALIPRLLTQVMRPEVMDLLDTPWPLALVSRRWKRTVDLLGAKKYDKDELGSWTLATIDEQLLLEFRHSPSELLHYLLRAVSKEADRQGGCTRNADGGHEMKRAALIAVLLGWMPNFENDGSLVFECGISQARFELKPVTETGDERATKRRRIKAGNLPWDSHRDYSPYVKGFAPTYRRLSDGLVERLVRQIKAAKEHDTESMLPSDEYRVKIRNLLKEMVSVSLPKKKQSPPR